LLIGLAAAVVVGFLATYEEATEAGRVIWYMTKTQVLTAYGDPAEVKFVGFGPYEKEVWVYRDPFRTVTFNQYDRVVDWSPKR